MRPDFQGDKNFMIKITIQKVKFEISLSADNTDQQMATDYAASVFYNSIQPELQNKLEQISDDELIRIDSIELNLGVVSKNKLAEAFSRELQTKVAEIKALQKNNKILFSNSNALSDSFKSSDESHLQTVLYFLSTGSFPWYINNNKAYTSIDAIFENVIQNNGINDLKEIVKLVFSDSTAFNRFAIQITPQLQLKFIAAVISEQIVIKSDALVFTKLFATQLQSGFSNNQIAFYLWLLQQFINENYLTRFSVDSLVLELEKQNFIPSSQLSKIKEFKKRLSANNKYDATQSYSLVKTTAEKIFKILDNSSDEETTLEEQFSEESILINNAGIVILFPFFVPFFEHLQLIAEGKFKNAQAQTKAIQVLHYLCYGTLKTPEHFLQLNKLVCNYPLHMPVPAKLKLSKTEKAECDELLENVLRHWKALKSNSVQGLRETFFQRNASLRNDGNYWILTVEKKGFDILMEHIPWSFRLVKLPWNKYIIHVDW